MRKVVIQGTPPVDWVRDAEAATLQLRQAASEDERRDLIEAHQALWRDDRIRNWLLRQFANKCWYTEAYDSVSSIHVDHFRPKLRSKDADGSESDGYWWLAFDWHNYRICGQLINVKKADVFPLTEGCRASADNPISLKLECPVLIDPTTDEARLIAYERDEDACLAVPAAGTSAADKERAERSIDILGLNRRDRLNYKRAEFWDKCLLLLAEHRGAEGPQVLRIIQQASALVRLREAVAYDAEFSSVSEACIRKNASESIVASVFEHGPSSRVA